MKILQIKAETIRWTEHDTPQNPRQSSKKVSPRSVEFGMRRKHAPGSDASFEDLYSDSGIRQKGKERTCGLVGLYEDMQKHLSSCERKTRGAPWPTPHSSQLEDEFNLRADRWRMETSFQSSLVAKFMHEDYQTVMAMGTPVIPLILTRLKVAHEHWFWALKHLARKDAAAGTDNPADAVKAWLRWGIDEGYID